MTIRSAALAKASQWMKEQRDSAESIQLRRTTFTDYDPSDGINQRDDEDTSVSAVIRSYNQYEIIASQRAESSTTIQPEDAQCKIAMKDLGEDITPAADDFIVRADASEWTVVHVGTDKESVFWLLQIRRP